MKSVCKIRWFTIIVLLPFMFISLHLDGKAGNVEDVISNLKSRFGIVIDIPQCTRAYSIGIGFRGNVYKQLLDDFFEIAITDTVKGVAVLISGVCLTDKDSHYYKQQIKNQILRSVGSMDENGNRISGLEIDENKYLTEISGAFINRRANADTLLITAIPLDKGSFIFMSDRKHMDTSQSVRNIVTSLPYMYKCVLYSSRKCAISFVVLLKDDNESNHLKHIIDVMEWFKFNPD